MDPIEGTSHISPKSSEPPWSTPRSREEWNEFFLRVLEDEAPDEPSDPDEEELWVAAAAL